MGFTLSLAGRNLRRTFLVFFVMSAILPILLMIVLAYYFLLPELTPDQEYQLKDVFTYGLSGMVLIPFLGFFLMIPWIDSLENLTKGIKTKMSLLIDQAKSLDLENEVAMLEFVFAELEQKTRQLKVENDERQRAEEALRISEEQYRGMIDNIPIGLYRNTADEQAGFLLANPAIANMFGYDSMEEFLNINVSDLYVDTKQRKEFTHKILTQGKVVGEELHLKKKDGTSLWGALTTRIIRDASGKVAYLDGAIEDITDRKKAEEALKKSEGVYRSFAKIGMALSAEKNINRLLEMIVKSARELSGADAGTLYILDDEEKNLRFEILQNDSLKIQLGGTSGQEVKLPTVPLYLDEKANYSNVSSYVALTAQTVNIEDVYEVDGFDFTGPRNYDRETGYRSKSMLVVPMKNHENRIIGVLQLLNAQDSNSGTVIPFSNEHVDMISSLASEAAVALTNTRLIHDLDRLLNAFIKSIATTIDEKSPYTGGHIKRVVQLTTWIAQKINQAETGPFKDVHFTEDELEELRMAAWMHDVGKIATPEHVVDKPNKLVGVFDRIDLIALRFDLIEKILERDYLEKKMGLISAGNGDRRQLEALGEEVSARKQLLKNDLDFIRSVSFTAEFMPDDKVERIKRIGAENYSLNGEEIPYLTSDEIENLCIRKGTLNDEERKIVENHALMTTKILNQLPFPRKLARVPLFAGQHHEKLDGTGYHSGLPEKDLPLQSRIIAFADIFEALTSKDRPYRKPMQLSQAIKIMGFMKKDRHIDPKIYDFFMSENIFLDYAEKEMNLEQIDLLREETSNPS